jgi:hypothetical protein
VDLEKHVNAFLEKHVTVVLEKHVAAVLEKRVKGAAVIVQNTVNLRKN